MDARQDQFAKGTESLAERRKPSNEKCKKPRFAALLGLKANRR
jgi:hypothetical protein